MFTVLAEEVYSFIPHTPAQMARYNRALAESSRYKYADRSEVYKEAAVSVDTLSGRSYLCFPDQCTCPDWSQRGPVIGDGSIDLCKHQIACHIEAQFVEPVPVPDEPPAYWPEELTLDPAEARAGCPPPPIADEDVAEPEAEDEEPEGEPREEDAEAVARRRMMILLFDCEN